MIFEMQRRACPRRPRKHESAREHTSLWQIPAVSCASLRFIEAPTKTIGRRGGDFALPTDSPQQDTECSLPGSKVIGVGGRRRQVSVRGQQKNPRG
jgi:hypothetical protein